MNKITDYSQRPVSELQPELQYLVHSGEDNSTGNWTLTEPVADIPKTGGMVDNCGDYWFNGAIDEFMSTYNRYLPVR